MVSQDDSSSSNPNSSVVHQFIISDSISSQPQFMDEHNNPVYLSDHGRINRRNPFPESLSVLSRIESLGHRVSRSDEHDHHVSNISEEEEEEEDTHNFNNRLHLMNLLEAAAAKETDNHGHGQRLSLSLGSHFPSRMLIQSPRYAERSLLQQDFITSNNYMISGEVAREMCSSSSPRTTSRHTRDDSIFLTSTTNASSSTSFETESFASVIGNSRYLKPTQSLLEEVVSVGGKAIDFSSDKSIQRLTRHRRREEALGFFPEFTTGGFFSSAAEHELQMKVSKLVTLLDEVENRYEQYYHQMEEVASSFEVIAGLGASKSYTALALQAMSRHFCSVRDAIVTQIKLTKRQFSQGSPRIRTGLAQLSLFDQEPRQNRLSLQELGLMQNQRQQWRPIRGLPENSVTILRSWLFEHFLHPYPNDSEKLMLSSQTGLSKNQVSNWFINARVRLWKPMIEEMYKAEFEEASLASDQSTENVLMRKTVSNHAEKHRMIRD